MEINGSSVIYVSSSLYVTPNTLPEDEDALIITGSMVMIAAIIAGVVVLGVLVLVYCLYRRKLQLEEVVANNDVLDKDSGEEKESV